MSADPTPTPDVIQLLQGHRSIRKFTDEPVNDEMVTEIIRSGLAAATSSNLQGTTVIRVRNPETRAKIAEVAGGQAYIESAAAFFVCHLCIESQKCTELVHLVVPVEVNQAAQSANLVY